MWVQCTVAHWSMFFVASPLRPDQFAVFFVPGPRRAAPSFVPLVIGQGPVFRTEVFKSSSL
eukprot:1785916-Karenia_brevis.AAC.1